MRKFPVYTCPDGRKQWNWPCDTEGVIVGLLFRVSHKTGDAVRTPEVKLHLTVFIGI
jgi:hypothetical protein